MRSETIIDLYLRLILKEPVAWLIQSKDTSNQVFMKDRRCLPFASSTFRLSAMRQPTTGLYVMSSNIYDWPTSSISGNELRWNLRSLGTHSKQTHSSYISTINSESILRSLDPIGNGVRRVWTYMQSESDCRLKQWYKLWLLAAICKLTMWYEYYCESC